MAVVLTYHGLLRLEERGIALEWVERTVLAPESIVPDPTQPGALRAYRVVPERGSRVLRVVYVEEAGTQRVLTVFFDRSKRR